MTSLIKYGLLLLLLLTFSAVPPEGQAADFVQKASAGQRLKAIIEDNYHPYTFINEQGKPDGFSVEITRAVAKTMDLEIDIRAGKWGVAVKGLETGLIDLIPVMAPSPERQKSFNFSVPYTVVYDAIFVKKGATSVHSLKELSGKKVIVTNNDLAHNYLVSSGLAKTMTIVYAESGPEALQLLSAGKGDAAIMPKLIGLLTIKNQNLTGIDTSPPLVDSYSRAWSFAVKAGNQALLERLNQGLNIIKNSGEYDDIYKKWFGELEGSRINKKEIIKYASFGVLVLLGLILWSVVLKRQVKAKTAYLEAEIKLRMLREKELLVRNAELDRFTYTASHDLKSPLITIQSYADMIALDLDAGNHARARDDLKRIERAAATMTDLLNDLLELSRVGKQMNEPSRIDMNRLVKDTLGQLAGLLEGSSIEVVINQNLPEIRGDRRRISVVLQNLIENSIKYMGDQATPRLEIGARNNGLECVFFVRDNGKGIEPHFHETIFGLFNQLDAKSEGTGVGLALVKRIIEMHGGRLWVESEGAGKGSMFCFAVPECHETGV